MARGGAYEYPSLSVQALSVAAYIYIVALIATSFNLIATGPDTE